MTATLCSSCGSRPAVSGDLCGSCESHQQYLGTDSTRASAKRLERARADLAALPDLVAELATCLTERQPDSGGGSRGKPGSRAPLRLDVLHLVDAREKPLWWGEDPRAEDMADRYGVLWQLASWSRVVYEEMPDADYLADEPTVTTEVAYLLAAWDWIGAQGWADEICDDVVSLASQCRSSLGVRREYRPRCRYCRNRVFPVDADGRDASWESCAYGRCSGCEQTYAPGPELATLARVQAPMTLTELASTTGIAKSTLRDWVAREWIAPAPESQGRPLYDLAEVTAVQRQVQGGLRGKAS